MDIKNKVVIITGASQGIGLATAKELAKHDAKIVLAARSEDKLIELSKEIQNSLVIKTDMTSLVEIKKLVNETIKKFGRIDILINNAGQGLYCPVENIDIYDLKKLMDLNLYGVINAMQAVIPTMRKQGGGMIINVSSAVTKNYYPGLAAYSSTKYALNAISHTARQELASDNIIVSSILPKMTSSNFSANSIGARPEFISDLIKSRPNLIIDTPEVVAIKINELIKSGEAELMV